MGPPPDRDIIMGPPPLPAPSPHQATLQLQQQQYLLQQKQPTKDDQEITDKYKKLKRRYFELEEVSVVRSAAMDDTVI